MSDAFGSIFEAVHAHGHKLVLKHPAARGVGMMNMVSGVGSTVVLMIVLMLVFVFPFSSEGLASKCHHRIVDMAFALC